MMADRVNISKQTLSVGIGGPVGSGKTALVDALCKRLRNRFQIGVVTNDIYTQEDAQACSTLFVPVQASY